MRVIGAIILSLVAATALAECQPITRVPVGAPVPTQINVAAHGTRTKAWHYACVRVSVPAGNGHRFNGSGVCVYADHGPQAIILTAWHVINVNPNSVRITWPDGHVSTRVRYLGRPPAKPCPQCGSPNCPGAGGTASDAAALLVSDPPARPAVIPPVADGVIPTRGARVTYLGYGGGNFRRWDTTVSDYQNDVLYTPRGVIPGDSGGAIVLHTGTGPALVGVVHGYTPTHSIAPCGRVLRGLMGVACPRILLWIDRRRRMGKPQLVPPPRGVEPNCPPGGCPPPQQPQPMPDIPPMPDQPQVDYQTIIDLMANDPRFRGADGRDGQAPVIDYNKLAGHLLAQLDYGKLADMVAQRGGVNVEVDHTLLAQELAKHPEVKGPQGPMGPQGEPGATPDIGDLSFTLRSVDKKTGEVVYNVTIKPGDVVDLPSVQVDALAPDSNKVVDTEHVALGGRLTLRLPAIKK